jgi:hypothetical protein
MPAPPSDPITDDPPGVLVDVVEQIEPAAGFWNKYVS